MRWERREAPGPHPVDRPNAVVVPPDSWFTLGRVWLDAPPETLLVETTYEDGFALIEVV